MFNILKQFLPDIGSFFSEATVFLPAEVENGEILVYCQRTAGWK